MKSSQYRPRFTSKISPTRHAIFTLKVPGICRPSLAILIGLLASALPVGAQMNTKVEKFDPISTAKVSEGLGFNLSMQNAWEFQKAAEMGAVEARMQFGWESVENMSGTLALTPNMIAGLNNCATYQIDPLIVAAYGSPRQTIGTVTVTANTAANSTVIPVSGAILSSIDTPRCHIQLNSGRQIVAQGKWAYYGALIHSVNTSSGTITLAAKTNVALTAGTVLRINRLLYPSVATTSSVDPSIVAYTRYAKFLATEIASRGLIGSVQLWNEPRWVNDSWDGRANFYDAAPPTGVTAYSPNWGILSNLLTASPPAGARFNWAGSNKTGNFCILNAPFAATQAQVQNSVASDSNHPYGLSPEWNGWDPVILLNNPISNWQAAALEGTNTGSNMKFHRKRGLDKIASAGWAPGFNVTETGVASTNQTSKARFIMRQFLFLLSQGYDRVNFYRLASTAPAEDYGFLDSTTQAPKQAFTAMKDLMTKINTLPVAPVAYTSSDLPTVTSYSGFYPLATIPVLGRASTTATKNQILFVLYQRSYPSVGQTHFDQVPLPAAVNATVQMPPGYSVVGAKNLTTLSAVSTTVNGSLVTLPVTADAVMLELMPTLPPIIPINAGFEAPVIANVIYRPTTATWAFLSEAGIARNGSSFGNPTAPQGLQILFLRGNNGNNGSISQSVTLAAGSYRVSFNTCRRASFAQQSFNVFLGAVNVGSYTPLSSTIWSAQTTNSVTLPAGSHQLRFVGTSTTGDATAFVDDIKVMPQ